MHARADATTCSIRKVVTFVGVRKIEVFGCWQRVFQIPFWLEDLRIGVSLGIIMDSPIDSEGDQYFVDVLMDLGQLSSTTYHQLIVTILPLGMK